MKRQLAAGLLAIGVVLTAAVGSTSAFDQGNGLAIKVLGYHVSWRPWTDSADTIPWDHLTNLSYFAVAAKPDGSLGFNDFCQSTPCWTDAKFASLVQAGHSRGVKVGLSLVAINAPDYPTYQDGIHAFLNPSVRDDLIANVLARLTAAGADGVDVDIEWPRPADAAAYLAFVDELTTAVHNALPGSYVYVAAPAWDYPQLNNYAALAAASDGLTIMGYGYHWDGSDPGPVSPISIGTTWNHPGEPYDLNQSLVYFANLGISSDKLLLGFPFYATEWPATSAAVPGTWTGEHTLAFPLIKEEYPGNPGPFNDCERRLSVSRQWDSDSQTPYRITSVGGGYRQLFCEDLASMGAKFELAKNKGVAGIFFWAENYLPPDYPIWKLLDQHFKQPPPANQAPAVSISIQPPSPTGPNQSVTLDGAATSDPDGDRLILQWALKSGPPGPALTFAAANEKKFTTVPQTPGNHEFTLTATDGVATSIGSLVLLVPGDTTPPTVSLQPIPGVVSGIVTVNATASDAIGVERMELLVDGSIVATDKTAPYSFAWASTSVGDGPHALRARAVDWSGNAATTPATTVTVDNLAGPNLVFVAPPNGATVNGNVTVTVNVSDPSGVAKVEFYVNGVSRRP